MITQVFKNFKEKSYPVTNKLKVNHFFNDLRFKSELLRITQNCNNIGLKSEVLYYETAA